MSLTISKDNDVMLIVPPNSEAPVVNQRIGTKPRTVSGFYVSKKDKEVSEFFDSFICFVSVDLAASFYFCHSLYESLINNCSDFYRDGLKNVQTNISLLEEAIANKKEYNAFEAINVSLGESKKYLKIETVGIYQNIFKGLILGDVIEIVFKKTSYRSVVAYIRPRGDVLDYVYSPQAFSSWLKKNSNI